MKIYTRKGDKGETSLFTGERVLKNNAYIDALGTIDECNSAIGAAVSFLPTKHEFHPCKTQLENIQHALFDLGAALATPRTRATEGKIAKTRFDSEATQALEHWIDQMEEHLPELHSFILPGGHPAGAMLHFARSFCRRAERIIVPLNKLTDVPDEILQYINRLSDYLFVLSRYINHLAHSPETSWVHHKKHEEIPLE